MASKGKESKAALEEKALTVIPEYMVEQNRPYSAIDVYNNMRQQYAKTMVVRALENGVSIGILKEKLISKQKIYYANQDRLPIADEDTLVELDKEITIKSETYSTLSAKYKVIQNELALLRSEETTTRLQEMIQETKDEVVRLRGRVTVLESARSNINEDAEAEGRALLAKEQSLASLASKRKRMACDILNNIREGCPLPKKQLYDSIGLELVEDDKM